MAKVTNLSTDLIQNSLAIIAECRKHGKFDDSDELRRQLEKSHVKVDYNRHGYIASFYTRSLLPNGVMSPEFTIIEIES